VILSDYVRLLWLPFARRCVGSLFGFLPPSPANRDVAQGRRAKLAGIFRIVRVFVDSELVGWEGEETQQIVQALLKDSSTSGNADSSR
jgi:hypothetical protein